jgi:hypothetical protein
LQPQTCWSSTSDTPAARLDVSPRHLGYKGNVLKKVLALLVIGFIVYYLLTAPAGAADAVSGAFDAVIEAFGQVGIFVDELAT